MTFPPSASVIRKFFKFVQDIVKCYIIEFDKEGSQQG